MVPDLFEHTGTATIIIINRDRIIDQVNSKLAELTGYSRNEGEGELDWAQLVHPDDYGRIRKIHHDRRIDPKSVPTAYTVRMQDRNGTVRTLHAVVAMIQFGKEHEKSRVPAPHLARVPYSR